MEKNICTFKNFQINDQNDLVLEQKGLKGFQSADIKGCKNLARLINTYVKDNDPTKKEPFEKKTCGFLIFFFNLFLTFFKDNEQYARAAFEIYHPSCYNQGGRYPIIKMNLLKFMNLWRLFPKYKEELAKTEGKRKLLSELREMSQPMKKARMEPISSVDEDNKLKLFQDFQAFQHRCDTDKELEIRFRLFEKWTNMMEREELAQQFLCFEKHYNDIFDKGGREFLQWLMDNESKIKKLDFKSFDREMLEFLSQNPHALKKRSIKIFKWVKKYHPELVDPNILRGLKNFQKSIVKIVFSYPCSGCHVNMTTDSSQLCEECRKGEDIEEEDNESGEE